MTWSACIHGRTMPIPRPGEPVTRPTCTDCEELVALREVETNAREVCAVYYAANQAPADARLKASLATLDRIRAARDTDRAPAPTACPVCGADPAVTCPNCGASCHEECSDSAACRPEECT